MSKTVETNRKMKESGTKWLGEIPYDWEVRKLKYIVNFVESGGTPTSSIPEFYSDNGVAWVSIADMSSTNFVLSTKKKVTELGIENKKLKTFPTGTLLYSIYATIGKVSELKIPATINQAILAIGANEEKILNTYLKYQLSAMESYVISDTSSSTQANLNAEKVKNFILSIPPLQEQQAIANYLDEQVGKIDGLISEQKQAIEKWKTYKQSLITETVTKGLNPDVEMKDSGIEWIGEIPIEWEVEKIKNKFVLRKEVNSDENAILLSLFTHIGVKPRSEMEEKGNKATTVINYSIVKRNDIIVNKLLAWMGAIAISDYEGVCSPDYDVYTLRDKNNCSKYYHYLFRTDSFKGECYRNGKGIMLMRLRTYYQEFKNIYIPKISATEQQAIADFLDEKCLNIDETIEQKQLLIQQLEEYKQSLIYECVTGKRWVRC